MHKLARMFPFKPRISAFACAAFCFYVPFVSATAFYKGVDISYVNQMEDCGVVYTDTNGVGSAYEILANRGANLMRVRLWHDPLAWTAFPTTYSSYPDVLEAVERAKTQGAQVLLDFHYSDTWADPGKQYIPSGWRHLIDDVPALAQEVFAYTSSVLTDLAERGLQPEFVQVGNEINGNIMSDTDLFPIDWVRQSVLINAAIDAIREVDSSNDFYTKVILHVADPANGDWWVQAAKNSGIVDFDVLGLSYYPQWHGRTIQQVSGIVSQLYEEHSRNVMLVEVGAPWTLIGNDAAPNILSSAPAGYPASPDGQGDWATDLADAVQESGGIGVVYWEPAWVTSECGTEWAQQGSHYENATFFDYNNALIEEGAVRFLAKDYPAVIEFSSSVPEYGELTGSDLQGQAFTPAENAYPNPGYPERVFLQMLRFTRSHSGGDGSAITVDILEPDGIGLANATFIGQSVNSVNMGAVTGTDYVFLFEDLPLDFHTTYIAIFKDPDGNPVELGIMLSGEGGPAASGYERGGAIFDYDTWGYSDDTNAAFTATFSTKAVAVRVPSLTLYVLLALLVLLATFSMQSKRRKSTREHD